jgi:hypothetical protein
MALTKEKLVARLQTQIGMTKNQRLGRLWKGFSR